MNGNYIEVNCDGTVHMSISVKAKEDLEKFRPRDCPFSNYSMFDLLKDWVRMYSWQMERNKKIPLTEFVGKIRTDGKWIYKDSMINILELEAV